MNCTRHGAGGTMREMADSDGVFEFRMIARGGGDG
jgi:hypothetical protein